jgi:apolipoprotein N-acyltransferase
MSPALARFSIPETRPFAVGGLALSALLMGLAQWVPGMAWLALIGLAPFWLVLRREGFLRGWARFAALFGGFALVSFYWLPSGGGRYCLLLLHTIVKMGLLAAVPALFYRAARGHLLAAPAGLMLAELASRKVLPGVGWVSLGQPLADYPPIAQVASVAGPEALTLLAAAASVSLVLAWQRRSALPLAAAAFVTVSVLTWGYVRLQAPAGTTRVFRVGVVQPLTSPQDERERGALRARIEGQIQELNKRFPPLIILPETVLPLAVRPDRELAEFASRTVKGNNVALMFGTHEKNEKSEYFNAAILVTPRADVTTYRKLRPTALEESVPAAFPFPKPSLPISPGERKVMFSFYDNVYFSALIGLEDTFPDLASEFRDRGTEMLVSLSDTRAYRSAGEALEHLRRAQLTALAAGLPMVRAASNGISCAIDSRGRVLGRLRPGSAAAGVFVVPLAATDTVYNIAGDAGEAVAALLAAAAGLWGGAIVMSGAGWLEAFLFRRGKERRRPGFEHLR